MSAPRPAPRRAAPHRSASDVHARGHGRSWNRALAIALGLGAAFWDGTRVWQQFGKSPDGAPPSAGSARPAEAIASSARVSNAPGRIDPAFNAQVNRGTRLLSEGKPAEAVQVLSEALRMNPADEDVHYDLGMALARVGKVEEAIRQYEEALRILPDYVEAHNNLGNLLMRTGHLDEAIQHFEFALKTMPGYASAHNNLGTALQQTGRTNEAIEHFQRAVQIKPDYWEAHFNVATSWLQAGRPSEARTELAAVLRLKPDFKPAQEALAALNPKPAAGAP